MRNCRLCRSPRSLYLELQIEVDCYKYSAHICASPGNTTLSIWRSHFFPLLKEDWPSWWRSLSPIEFIWASSFILGQLHLFKGVKDVWTKRPANEVRGWMCQPHTLHCLVDFQSQRPSSLLAWAAQSGICLQVISKVGLFCEFQIKDLEAPLTVPGALCHGPHWRSASR